MHVVYESTSKQKGSKQLNIKEITEILSHKRKRDMKKILLFILILILCSAPSIFWPTSEKYIELYILLFHVSIQVILSSQILHHTFNITQLSSIPHSQKGFLLFSRIVFLTYPSFFQSICLFLPHLSQPLHWTNKSLNIPKDVCPMLRAVPKIVVFWCMLALVVLWSRKITSGPH